MSLLTLLYSLVIKFITVRCGKCISSVQKPVSSSYSSFTEAYVLAQSHGNGLKPDVLLLFIVTGPLPLWVDRLYDAGPRGSWYYCLRDKSKSFRRLMLVAPYTLFVSGYHADTPITIKAEPSIWPTAAFINIHEHPL